jgi:preprotein translocase subunit SecG
MLTLISVVHVIFCFLLIALVLLQDPKSNGGGGMFGGGGGTSSLLGATGAVTFLTKMTRYSAIVFGITCISLTLLSKPITHSVLDSAPVGSSAPAAPEGAPTSQTNPAAPAPDTHSEPAAPAAPAGGK